MWKLVMLAMFAATAAADPQPGFRAKTSCSTTGAVLVEVDRIKAGTPPVQQTTKIFESGGWSASDAKPDELSGCAPDADFREVRAAVSAATWKITKAGVHCNAMSVVHTDYLVKGTVVWTAKLCSGESLDKDSAAAIDLVNKLVTKLAPNRAPL